MDSSQAKKGMTPGAQLHCARQWRSMVINGHQIALERKEELEALGLLGLGSNLKSYCKRRGIEHNYVAPGNGQTDANLFRKKRWPLRKKEKEELGGYYCK